MPPRLSPSIIRCLRRNAAPPALTINPAVRAQSAGYVTAYKYTKYTKNIPVLTSTPAESARTFPPTQPPSFKNPNSMKTLLSRLYLSLLRSSPLTVIFQHNSVRAVEWIAIRRELANILRKVDTVFPEAKPLAPHISISIVYTNVLAVTMRIADKPPPGGGLWTHGTSVEATGGTEKSKHQLVPLLSGPVALLTFPEIAPAHITAAMNLLFPATRTAPKKGFDPLATAGLAKLILLAARVQERPVGMPRLLDGGGIRMLGDLKSIDEMRGEMLAMLQSMGGGEIVRALESMGISLGRTVEARRRMLEEEAGGENPAGAGAAAP